MVGSWIQNVTSLNLFGSWMLSAWIHDPGGTSLGRGTHEVPPVRLIYLNLPICLFGCAPHGMFGVHARLHTTTHDALQPVHDTPQRKPMCQAGVAALL